MIYFIVDCDLDMKTIDEKDLKEWISDWDSRIFRTDGKIVEGSWYESEGVVSWKLCTDKFNQSSN